MNVDDFENYARDLAYKSVYSFTLLCFSTLALSIQFSTGFGKTYLCIVFIAWVLLLISSIAGGWIVTKMPIFYRINAGKVKIEKYLNNINNPEFRQVVKIGSAYTSTGSWTVEMLEQTLKIENNKLEIATRNMEAISGKLPIAHKIQTWCYLFGLFFNLAFIIRNLV